jgi:hypothetical protein
MQLRDIVEIDQQGLVADAVNLSMMASPDMNRRLCQGFVFNYDAAQPKSSTLGVLDALRESFHSANNPNVHLMVQDFGKGKSHFALTVANFFKQPSDSPEIEGILNRIKFVTSGQTQAIYERLKAYKVRSKPHLVLCISGESSTDLGKAIVRALQTALEEQGIGGTLAQHFIQAPLNYLQNLSSSDRQQVEAFLENLDGYEKDLASLIDDLKEGEYDLIPIVKDISAHLNNGLAFDFQLNLDVEAMFEEVIQEFCNGENRRFEGILILFDELNAYLRIWLKNPAAAGGYVLQNITNICGNNRGKVALLCLAQVKPSLDTQVSTFERKNYERFTTRIELAPSIYEPESSLELVIDKLLKQSECDQWQAFHSRFDDTLRGESRNIYEHYITAYKQQKWSFEKFHKHLGLGCYPLHPMTASLLCQLEFTQGRTAIQFIKEDVANFIENTTISDEIQFVYPVQLMDAFKSDFAQQSIYEDFKKAYDNIAANASEDEITVLKAIGLYYLSGDKITKPAKEKHEEILSLMTGYSVPKTKAILDKLSNEYQAVYFNSGNNTYRFYSGFSINDLRRKLEEDVENRPASFDRLLEHCRSNLSHYLGSDTVRADRFVNEHRLNGEDWQFERQVFTVDEFERKLSTECIVKSLSERGLIAYFIGQYDKDMQALEKAAEDVLARAPQAVQERIIIAIPRRGTRDLARVLLMKDTLSEKSTREKQEFGPALAELTKQFDTQLDFGLQEVFDNCAYTCRVINKVPINERKRLEPIASKMLEELYIYVPPVESQDKLRTKSTKGANIVSYASRQLLGNDLKEPFPDKAFNTLIETVFVRKWGLLKKGNPYTVQVPLDPSIRQAWDTISAMTEINEREQSTTDIKKIWNVLSEAPYGHNDLTFTILFSAWLGYHRGEVELSGGFGIPIKKSDSVSTKSAPIHEWAQTNILEKAKDFVQTWIVQMNNKVIRRKPLNISIPDSVNYDEAVALLEQIKTSRQTGLLDRTKAQASEKSEKQLQKGIDQIDAWLRPTQKTQALLSNQPSLDVLAGLYSPLEQSPPVVIKEGVIVVRATDDQTNTWRQTRQALREKIESLVEGFANRAQDITSVDQGYTLNAEINHKIKSLENVPELPSRFIDSLKAARESINQRIQTLQEAEKTREVLDQVQRLYEALGANAPQSQYSSVLANIKELAEQSPAIQQEEAYLKILRDIETQQDELTQKLDRWESRFAALSSINGAYQLSEEVNREINRFDQEESHQQVNSLTARIKAKILEQQNEEEEEASLKATVEQARQKSQAIAKLINVADAIQSYDDLSRLALPSTQKTSNVDAYHQQLEALKVEGKQAIDQKFEQLFQACHRDIKTKDEYTQRKGYIVRAKKLISDHAEFSVLQDKLQVAEDTLESKFTELKKQAEDKRLLLELQKLRPAEGNTIKRCEEIIARIEETRSNLHFADQHQDTIDRLLKAFQGKRAEYSLQLDELTSNLQTADTINQLQQLRNELSKLEFVFRDSSEYDRHQAVERRLRNLSEDLEHTNRFESQGQNAQSIASIQKVLNDLAATQGQLHDIERFQERLQALQATLQQRQQQYVDELAQWQQSLEALSASNSARKLYIQVTNKASHYTGSEYEDSFNALSADLEALTRLLELVDVQKTDTIDDCQTEIERLDGWKSTQAPLSERLEQRIQHVRTSLIQTQQTIQERERKAAQQQLSSLHSEVSQLNTINDADQKLAAAKVLLKEIRQTRSQYDAFLEDEQKDALRECQQRCEDVQAQDYASQIETLFQRLPKEKRIDLYHRLSAYLEATTEVF